MTLHTHHSTSGTLPSDALAGHTTRRRRLGRGAIGVTLAGTLAVGSFVAVAAPVAAAPRPASPVASATSLPVVDGDLVAVKAAMAVDTFAIYSTTSNRRALDSFEQQLGALATDVAGRLGLDPARVREAWAAADRPHQVALVAGLSQLGVRYRRNTSKPGVGFDCSGLTLFAWGQAGVELPRSSRSQINAAAKRSADTAQAGDLVYYPGHVMMWLGVDGAILHSPFTGRTVEVSYVASRKLKWLRFGDPTG